MRKSTGSEGGAALAALASVRGVVARDGDDLARPRDGRPQAHAPARLDDSGAQQIGGVVAVDGVRGELERGARHGERRGAASQEGMHLGGQQRIGFGLGSADVFAGEADRERAIEIDDRAGVGPGGQHGAEPAHTRARRFQGLEAERGVAQRGRPAARLAAIRNGVTRAALEADELHGLPACLPEPPAPGVRASRLRRPRRGRLAAATRQPGGKPPAIPARDGGRSRRLPSSAAREWPMKGGGARVPRRLPCDRRSTGS